ncbi:MAG: DUF1667 domain-containing protein [Firmicutes bacterium]|nr:DUF1667 domain-containing protein [Bacillota bacterium]
MTELTCIVCPVGCRIRVERDGNELKISGHGCPRGLTYAREEITAPKRILTAVVKVAGSKRMLPVKTKVAIPKAKLFPAMQEIKAITVSSPVTVGQVITDNLAESGVPLVATGTIPGDD